LGLKYKETGAEGSIMNEMDGTYIAHGDVRNLYKSLVGNPEGKRPLGRPKHR
jgi:hypothetical protein